MLFRCESERMIILIINNANNLPKKPPFFQLRVGDIMNTNFETITPNHTLRDVIRVYNDVKIDTIPVVDEQGALIAVFPRRSLYQALLNGAGLTDPCSPYIVYNPVFNYAKWRYTQDGLIAKAYNSKVGNAPVLDESGNVVGVVGKLEYLRETLIRAMNANDFLESIFQAMYEGFIIIDNNGFILKINKFIENTFKYGTCEINGQHIHEVFPEIELHAQPVSGIKCTIRNIPFIMNQTPMITNNEQTGLNIALFDLSDMEKIARELEMVKELQNTLSEVLNTSSDGVFVSTKNGDVKYGNEMAADLFQTPADGMVGQPIANYINSEIPFRVSSTGVAEVDICKINDKNCIVSHVPIHKEANNGETVVGVVSTVYSAENKITDNIAKKWLSLQQQVQRYRDELEKSTLKSSSFDKILTQDSQFLKLKSEAQKVAKNNSTVLLTGESGVGKDMFARAIHATSTRSGHPFVKVNCAAIPETLLESELFGYEPGSFTGALKSGKPGYFEQAHMGTIFLDEIGDMPLSIQVKLLQVIQEKQFMRVGGTSPKKVDVRIIAATNRDLKEAIANGQFREDLYYRLNVIAFHLPPLRERPADVIPLAEMLINKYNKILDAKITGLTSSAQEALMLYSWPGNIRELENAIERSANYAMAGDIGIEHLPLHILQCELKNQPSISSPSYRAVMKDVDKDLIIEALQKTNGNKSAAARMLKISRSAFYVKLSKYGIV